MYKETGKMPVPNRDLRRAEAQNNTFEGASPIVASPPSTSGAFLVATKGELEDAMKNLVDLNGRLGALADRVFGSQPETSGTPVGGAATESFGVAAEIEGRVNAIHALIQAAHFTAARLERI